MGNLRLYRSAILCLSLAFLVLAVAYAFPGGAKTPHQLGRTDGIPEDLSGTSLYTWFLCGLVVITMALVIRYLQLCTRKTRLDLEVGGVKEDKRKEYKHLGIQIEQFRGYLGALSIFHLTLIVAILVTEKLGLIESSIIPSPSEIFARLNQNLGALTEACRWSLLRLGVSLLVGACFAVLLGVPLGQNNWLRRRLEPHIAWVSGIPPIVLAGVFVAILGPKMLATTVPWLREPGASEPLFNRDLLERWYFRIYFEETIQIVLTTWAIFWPIFTAAVAASAQCPRTLLEAAEICGATARQKIRVVVRPQALPHILTNLRVGVVIGFIVLLWIEAARPSRRSGLGKWVYEYYEQNDVAGVFACILLTVALVFVVLQACELLQRRQVRWLAEYLTKGEEISIASSALSSAKPSWNQASLRSWLDKKRVMGNRAEPSDGTAVLLEGVSKSYGAVKALDMSQQVMRIGCKQNGNIVSIIGKSSHGKTTLAKLIAGLLQPEPGIGRIEVFDQELWGGAKSEGLARPPTIAYVFQDFALFPHMTVRENIAFPLRLAGTLSPATEEAMEELLDLLGMQGQENKYPSQLSGGQKQRVAIARALIQEARLLILDEPLASLDQPARGEIRLLVREYARAAGLVVLNVSHDRQDVLEMSDQVIYLKDGRVADCGPPDRLFFRPRLKEVARFLGHENLFLARLDYPIAQLVAVPRGDGYNYLPENAQLRVPLQRVSRFEEPLTRGTEHDVCIPSSWINFRTQNSNGCPIRARICDYQSLGYTINMNLMVENALPLNAIVQDDDFKRRFPNGLSADSSNRLIEFSIEGATPIFQNQSLPSEITL